jgi:hypothetical protein
MDELQARATNETLVGEALAPLRDRVGIATKSGFKLDPTTGATIGVDSRPDHIAPVRVETPPFMVGAHPDISAPIMIRCSSRTGGRRTCGFSRSTN